MFNDAERLILRDTTFQKIIARNLEIDDVDGSQFIKSIWTVQPLSQLQSEEDAAYPNKIDIWTSYSVKYRLDETHIYFKVELQTDEGEGWFGMVRHDRCLLYLINNNNNNFFLNKGFDPSDNGMNDAEFIIGI